MGRYCIIWVGTCKEIPHSAQVVNKKQNLQTQRHQMVDPQSIDSGRAGAAHIAWGLDDGAVAADGGR